MLPSSLVRKQPVPGFDIERTGRYDTAHDTTHVSPGVHCAAAATAVPASVTAQRKLGPLGLQLYSVRDLLKHDFAGTLQKIAAIGFKEVEFAGLFGLAPAE